MPSPWKVSPSPSLSACTSFLNDRSIAGSWRNFGYIYNDFRGNALASGRCIRLPLPHLARDLDHVGELAPLLVLAHHVAFLGAGETALRAQLQPREVDVAGGLVDAPLDRVLWLERGQFAADQSKHDVAVLGHEAQRLEPAG